MAKSIANRIKKVLTRLIDSSQTGFIKGRYIGENIRLLFDIIEYTEEHDIPGMLLFTDFEKAFDIINNEYITEILNYLVLVKISNHGLTFSIIVPQVVYYTMGILQISSL